MDFRINCPCGQGVTVTEGAAERTVACACGRALSVPSLTEMRRQAGLPPYNITPEMMIEYLLPIGRLPGSKVCVQCGAETDDSVQILTECERVWVPKKSWLFWVTVFLGTLLVPFAVFRVLSRESDDGREYGEDKVYSLPLPICKECQPALRGRKAIKRFLHKIPEYSRLLEKFPDTKVTLQ